MAVLRYAAGTGAGRRRCAKGHLSRPRRDFNFLLCPRPVFLAFLLLLSRTAFFFARRRRMYQMAPRRISSTGTPIPNPRMNLVLLSEPPLFFRIRCIYEQSLSMKLFSSCPISIDGRFVILQSGTQTYVDATVLSDTVTEFLKQLRYLESNKSTYIPS